MKEMPPLTGIRLLLATIALGLGTFIQILDISITNVSIPDIAGSIGVSAQNGTWVITSFAISNGVVLLLTGWLVKRVGEVRLFVWSTGLFTIASLLCGQAHSLGELIAFRILQGAVAGTLIPLSQSLIMQNYPPEKRNIGLGFWSMIVVVAPIFGPILGGWITDNWGWPWIFYINLPFGALSSLLAAAIIKERRLLEKCYPLDYVGLLLLIISIGCLQTTLDRGNDDDWFHSPSIRILVTISFITFCFWVVWELFHKYPLVDLSIFKSRNFTLATLSASLIFFVFYGGFVLVPLWLQTQQGYTPFEAGLVLSGTGLVAFFLAPLVGRYLHVLDLRIWATLSFFMIALSFFWAMTFTAQVTFMDIFIQRAFQGIGTALFFVPLVSLALQGIQDRELASASGIFNFMRTIAGGGFGTSLFITYYTRRESLYHTAQTDALTHMNPNVQNYYSIMDKQGFTVDQANQYLVSQINKQTYLLSMNDLFLLAGCLSIALIALIWCIKKPEANHRAPAHLLSE